MAKSRLNKIHNIYNENGELDAVIAYNLEETLKHLNEGVSILGDFEVVYSRRRRIVDINKNVDFKFEVRGND